MEQIITLKQLQLKINVDETVFLSAYTKLITRQNELLSQEEIFLLLKVAAFCLNNGEHEVNKFGYRIILRYSNAYNDYI
ncbi:MAG: hypothetical protein WCO10_01225, partial [bacterium]